LKLQSVRKSFGDFEALKGVDLDISDGEFVVFVGPSGCGKSTLLRVIAGLEEHTSGHVLIDDRMVDVVPPAKRGIAMVFQTYALYPHLTARGNMELGLKQEGRPRAEIDTRVAEAARMLALEPLLERRPSELSGGQRQRVAIGRAVVRKPRLFLFDEPLSNLDAGLRVNTRLEIARLRRLLKATIIYVTHDQVEAMTLADRIVILNHGRIEQIGTPEEVFHHPANEFVMNFLGHVNVFQAREEGDRTFYGPLEVGSTTTPLTGLVSGKRAFVRPHELDLDTHANGSPSFRATIRFINVAGPHVRVELISETNEPVFVELPHERHQQLQLNKGDLVFVTPRKMKVFVEDYVI
jgi:multiple sugar transport system ATP-binding protein